MSAALKKSAAQARHQVILNTFTKLHPYASDFEKQVGFQEMSTAKASIGTMFKVNPMAKVSVPVLPSKIWGVTACFKLNNSTFSEIGLRTKQQINSGEIMHQLQAVLGEGPNFQCVQGKADVMHMGLPERRGHDTTDWAPHFGPNDSIKIVHSNDPFGDAFLVVDIDSLPHAETAYENLFGTGRTKKDASTISSHYINSVLERTAVRNAQKVAKNFADLAGIQFDSYTRDLYSKDGADTLPELYAVSVDKPMIPSINKNQHCIMVASGMRSACSFAAIPLVTSPGKMHTFVSQGLVTSTILPAYFSTVQSPKRTTINLAAKNKFRKERVFYRNKPNDANEAHLDEVLPEEDVQEYVEFAKKSGKQFIQLSSVAVFTL